MAGEDFVHVQLSPAGEKRAAGAPIRFTVGRRSFEFEAGKAQRVDKSYEWGVLLSKEFYRGEPMFVIAPPMQQPPEPPQPPAEPAQEQHPEE